MVLLWLTQQEQQLIKRRSLPHHSLHVTDSRHNRQVCERGLVQRRDAIFFVITHPDKIGFGLPLYAGDALQVVSVKLDQDVPRCEALPTVDARTKHPEQLVELRR